jgi:hypothetical protein
VRDTTYATELASASVQWGESEGRIERLMIKEAHQEEIRFSWWNEGRMIPRPLDLGEDDLLILFERAIAANVFTVDFRSRLRAIL